MSVMQFQKFRWWYIAAIALLATALTLAILSPAPQPNPYPAPLLYSHPAQEHYPNIVVILVDDLGYGDVRANFSESKIATPHIDQLAAQGMRFTDAHSGTAVCSPSRYGLLTGQHFSRQDWWRVQRQLWASMIDDDRLTLGAFLQANGYHTGAFGKWHLGQTFYDKKGRPGGPAANTDWSRPITGGPNDRGFDEYYGVLFTHAHFLQALVSNGLVTQVPTELSGKAPKAKDYNPVDAMPLITQKALEYIDWNVRERPGEPFFLYFPTPAIHDPILPSPEFSGKSDVGPYGDFVMQTDAAVGQIIAKIDEYGLRENTLIILTSDNGGHGKAGLGSVEETPFGSVYTRYGHKMNGNWRGLKGSFWEGGHRVPFIASWPGHIAPASVDNNLIVLEDLMATFAAILGVELPAGSAEDSYNILPYLDGTHTGPPIREYTVLNTFYGDPVLRKGKWVLSFHRGSGEQFTKNLQPGPGEAKGELYDLEADPGQTTNLWLKYPKIVAELTAFYDDHVARGSSFGVDR
jgi:arylsulfatase A